MVGANLGPDYDLARRLTKLEEDVHNLNTRDVLKNASIGSGGITVTGGLLHVTGTGGILVDGGGSISVPSGSLSTAGSITAGGVIVGASGMTNNGNTHLVGSLQVDSQINGNGDATVAGDFHGTNLYATAAPGFNITGTRVAAWLESATGRLGMATSSRRFKQDIVDAGLDPEAILGLGVKYFRYIADPRHLNVGMIAEDLHAAGLWEFVQYEREVITHVESVKGKPMGEWSEDGPLILDDDGQPIPFGIHYEMFSLAVLVAVQYVFAQHRELAAEVAQIKAHLGL